MSKREPPVIRCSPPIDAVALTWAERSRDAYRAGDVRRAVACAQKAVDGHARFGSRKVATPQLIRCCEAILKMYENKETE